jgi:anthranilate phosphoribosyltransferase
MVYLYKELKIILQCLILLLYKSSNNSPNIKMTNFTKFLEDDFFSSSHNATEAFCLIADGKVSTSEIEKFLTQINKFGIKKKTIFEAVLVFRQRMRKVNFDGEFIDVCGTGGDGINSLNISTAVCFVLAAAGVKVAKHGNRAVSSKSGSSDLLQEVGYKIDCSNDEIIENLEKHNLAFLFAPRFHPAFLHVAQARQNLGVKTIFNYLGPLLNPLKPKKQIIGVSNAEIVKFIPQIFCALGGDNCFAVHGLDGMDEISISANSLIYKTIKINQDNPIESDTSREIFNPEDFGFQKRNIADIKGGDAKYNVQKLRDLLSGQKGVYHDIVVLNSSFAFLLSGKVGDLRDGINLAKEVLCKFPSLFTHLARKNF